MIFDLTGIAITVIGGFMSILTTVAVAQINARMSDRQSAVVLDAAITNSLGAMQQAATAGISTFKPQVTIPGVTPMMAVGVQYVLDHAGDEATSRGITAEAIADKINARIGLRNIETNIAVAASALPLVPEPLAPLVAIPATLAQSKGQSL